MYMYIYRAPPFSRFLAVYVGSGLQLFVMTILTLIFATLGYVVYMLYELKHAAALPKA